ncbi:MAG: hypothetical protein QXM08_00525 [Thermofilaceae archaeon]
MRLRRRGVREFVEQLCEDFRVEECPRVEIVSTADVIDECGWFSSGCYNYEKKAIFLDENMAFMDSELVLHEFCHYLQHLRMGTEEFVKVGETEAEKEHCERSLEAEAKGFAMAYHDFYKRKWERLAYRE